MGVTSMMIWQLLQSSLAKTGWVKSQKECWTVFASKLFCHHIENSTTPFFVLHNLSFLQILNFRICVLLEKWRENLGAWITQKRDTLRVLSSEVLGQVTARDSWEKKWTNMIENSFLTAFTRPNVSMGVWYLAGALKVPPLSTRKLAFCPHRGSNRWPSAPHPRPPFEEWQVKQHIPTTTQRPACYDGDRLKTLSKRTKLTE